MEYKLDIFPTVSFQQILKSNIIIVSKDTGAFKASNFFITKKSQFDYSLENSFSKISNRQAMIHEVSEIEEMLVLYQFNVEISSKIHIL